MFEAESGWVEAGASCDHLASLSSDLAHIPTPDTPCNRCDHQSENWLCLSCKDVLCSRYVNKHMLQHFQQTNHSVALSYSSDLSVWCFICDAYLDAKVNSQLRPVYETAYILQFGKAAPFQSGCVEAQTSCVHLASLSSDLAHIPTPDTPCNSSDLSVWCFICNAYLDAKVISQLRPVYETAYILKFGKAAPFQSGWVEARTSCDHLASLSSDLAHIPVPDSPCNRCNHPSENWLCLSCKDVLCSRYVNKHMLQHFHQTNHSVALSYSSDLSVWCFICNAYLDAKVISQLRPVYETAYILKFGKAAPFQSGWVEARTSCDHLASLSSDLAHIPIPDSPCNRCNHPSENWLCLSCKDVLCSRYVNKHMLQHFHQTNHSVVLSYSSDLSVWCYICDAYLDAEVISQLRPVYETASILKSG
ncbi:hypothetical protein Patl1_35344 [Pistacia atlantica]|nr:hypothetical protein Patl1_35344 [Pistacia atlantica]